MKLKFQKLLYRDLIYVGAFFAVGLLYLFLYLQRRQERSSLWFSLFCFMMALRGQLTETSMLDKLFSDQWIETLLRLEYVNLTILVIVFYFFITSLFPDHHPKIPWLPITLPSMAYALISVVLPIRLVTLILPIYQAFLIIVALYCFLLMINAVKDKKEWAVIMLLLMILVVASSLLDVLYFNHIISIGPFSSHFMFLMVLFQGVLLITRFTRSMDVLEKLHRENNKTTRALLTSKKQIEDQNLQLNQLTFIDQLTQLPNRISFQNMLENKMAQARREDRLLAVIYLDMDNFRRLNETLGQQSGDQILYRFSQRIKKTMRKSDRLFRYTSDEFVILVEDLKQVDQLEIICNKLFGAFVDPFNINNEDFFITLSIGIAHWNHDDKNDDINTLVRKADVALAKAKDQGKNGRVYYTQDMDRELLLQTAMTQRMKNALENDYFELFYQAQIDLSTGLLHGFEALIRWNDADEGYISPGQFIPLAEENGFIVQIGKWVLQESCRQLRQWLDMGHRDFTLSVNLSVHQFERDDLIPHLKEVIEQYEIPPQYLVLELTESSLMMDSQRIIERMYQLRDLGLKIAIDDFGTGYSNLGYLSSFPLDILKIDRMFISNIRNNDKDRKLVTAIINIAHSLDLEVVAEGVEEEVDRIMLGQQGCHYIQCFLYSKPCPHGEAESFFDFIADLSRKS
jgi:diguanylate cyclase (GGDEF)-like protein